MEDQMLQNLIEKDRARFRVGDGRLRFRRTQENVGYDCLRADGDMAFLHCYNGKEAPRNVTCVVLSRYQTEETWVYIGQCVCCGTVWISEEEDAPHEALSRATAFAYAGR